MRSKENSDYRSFDYLIPGVDYRSFELADELNRVAGHLLPLSEDEEERVDRLRDSCVKVSLHEHLGVFPARVEDTPAYLREGRMATAFQGLAACAFDAILDNLMNGICRIESKTGWKWTEVLHDLGMRLCDLAHQDSVIVGLGVDDILRAHEEGKVAWIASMEGAAMIENELDRIEILYGFGVRCLGIAYSEANALGSGLKEPGDGGLTAFGRKAVERMNKVGMLIDCSHCGDQTSLDTIEVSEKPIVLSHIGARTLWDSRRLAPDEVLTACAEKGGVIGIEAAPHTTITRAQPRHSLKSFMEHFEFIKDLVGIDHVGFGPDTLYGDHVGLHRVYSAGLSLDESRKSAVSGQSDDYPRVEFVAGVENPTEASHNILRWLVKKGYSDEDIGKVVGGNALRVMREVWYG
ncbi:dipeptidase [Gemmatimonadota bacterium]